MNKTIKRKRTGAQHYFMVKKSNSDFPHVNSRKTITTLSQFIVCKCLSHSVPFLRWAGKMPFYINVKDSFPE